ncbi:hypothetical protein PYW07_012844 [Mythimna separata]|uniref:Uncharacterized protein n=1 Tax=Mythimna separata TaxID=271217 RepID=A0AAD7Y958_MYTSE|nr:hypothetical protein PYW07_012844 [Mythimna separata]
MEESQPSTSRSAVEDNSQPSTSRSVVRDEPQSSSSSSEDAPPAKQPRHLSAEEIRGMWNLVKVYRQLGTREQAVLFAEERGMITRTKMCNYHKKPMTIDYKANKTVGSFACYRGTCRSKPRLSRGKEKRL